MWNKTRSSNEKHLQNKRIEEKLSQTANVTSTAKKKSQYTKYFKIIYNKQAFEKHRKLSHAKI